MGRSVVYALAAKILRRRGWLAALAVVLQFDTYLRAASLLAIHREDLTGPQKGAGRAYRHRWSVLVAPMSRGRPTKGGEFNESVLIGDLDVWLPKFFSEAEPFLPGSHEIFNFDHVQYAEYLREASKELGLPWIITPHQLRHSGPSHDRFHRLRSLPDIQARGLWKQFSSVKINEKHAMFLTSMAQLSSAQQRAFRKLESDLPGLFREACKPSRKRKR